jgi:predicted RNA-binding protein with PIN domain
MHYYIDGYNLLFRLMQRAHDDLQTYREAIIQDLNQKAAVLNLDISIVFDATFQIGDRTRTHFNALEILFTAHGETADEYIIDELKQSPHPQKETVVTSDKKLAWRARSLSAHTVSIEDFLLKMNKSYRNKQQRLRKTDVPVKRAVMAPASPKEEPAIPPENATVEACTDYYARIFEAEWQELVKEQQIRKEEAAQEKRPVRRPRQKKDPFQPPPAPEPDAASEMDRWLKLFQKEP